MSLEWWARTVIASGAKQSISPHKGRMDCFVASLLAMTVFQLQTQLHVLAARYARAVDNLRPKEGAGNAGCALHPRSRVQDAQRKTHTSIQVQRRHSGIPRAMVLRLMPRSPATN